MTIFSTVKALAALNRCAVNLESKAQCKRQASLNYFFKVEQDNDYARTR